MDDIAIQLTNVSKFYKLYNSPKDRLKEALNPFGKEYHRKFYALKGINLEVKKGEVLGIVGKNGSGKSTLLKLITGVLGVSQGEVKSRGKIVALLELGAGFNPNFTGIENIYFYGTVLGLDKKEVDAKLDEIIAFADIGEFIYQPIKSYSSGMKARLGFAVAAHVEPEILILDEVLAVGDIAFKAKCFRKVDEFLSKRKTVLLVSHNANNINQLCGQAILLQNGAIKMQGAPKEVTQEYEKSAYGVAQLTDDSTKDGNDTHSIKIGLWDKGIITQPILMIPDASVKTSDYVIHDSAGSKVNVLRTDEKYEFSFQADIAARKLEEILFGFTFVNSIGVRVLGIEPRVNKAQGSKVELKASFPCILNEDLYTLIVSTRSRVGEMEFCSRVENIGAYRVINDKLDHRWGLTHIKV